MKIQLIFAAVLTAFLSSQGVQAFTAPNKPSQKTALQGQRNNNNDNNWFGPVAVTAMGWALASQVAIAGMLVPQQDQQQLQLQQPWTSTVLAVEQLDFALPKYDAIGKSKGGFGEGTEARLGVSESMIDPGANEKAKQAEAMKKAEDARLEKKRADKQRRQEQYEADLKRQEEKKADADRRIKELFE